MKQMAVLSGKGGTGKTSVTAALATLAAKELRLVLVDSDVDAANLELVLSPTLQTTNEFIGARRAIIDGDLCSGCGICREVCRYDAIVPDEPYQVDSIRCEGCAACFYQCPEEAIRMESVAAGRWHRSNTRFGMLFHAYLYAGQETTGLLVSELRKQSQAWGNEHNTDLIMVDGPPGIGCPVIATCTGMDLALMVTEPTVSGIHDLKRILATTDHFGVPALVCINKVDINPRRADEIRAFCEGRGTEVAVEIPFDRAVPEAMVSGIPVTEYGDGLASNAIEKLWQIVRQYIWRGDSQSREGKTR